MPPPPGRCGCCTRRAVKPVRNEFGSLVWEIGDGPDTVRTDRDGYLLMPGNMRLIVLRDPHGEVDAEGRSVGMFERNRSTFGLSDTIDNYTAGIYRSGVPAGFLKVTAPGLGRATRPQVAPAGVDERSTAATAAPWRC